MKETREMIDEPKAPGSEKGKKREAKQLAKSQGLNWKELSKEKKKEFKAQAKSAGSQSSGGKPRKRNRTLPIS
jgi:hypothetical protein